MSAIGTNFPEGLTLDCPVHALSPYLLLPMAQNSHYVRCKTKLLPSIYLGWPTIAVDTHIYRVSNRTKLAIGKTVEKVEEKLIKVIPAEFEVDVHHWLILHGRYTCIARKPRCGSCIIEDLCEFKDKTE
jgi:endonuclease-3